MRRDRGDGPSAVDGGDGAVDGEVLADYHQGAAPQPACVHTAGGGAGHEPVRPPRPEPDRLRGLARPEQDGVAVDVEHAAHLQRRRRDRHTVDDQPPRPVGVGDGHQRARGRVRGHPGHDVDPDRVGALVVEGRRTGGRVDAERAQGRLVAGLDDDEQPVVVPDDVGQVLLAPPDRGPPPVQRDDLGADQRVRRSRCRVGDDRGLAVGVRGVGDVPALDGRVVDAGDDQRVPRRRPPDSRASAPSPRPRRSRRARS